MEPKDWISTGITSLVAIVAIWLTNHLAERRHRRERSEEDHLAADRKLWAQIQEELTPWCIDALRAMNASWNKEDLAGLDRFFHASKDDKTRWFHDHEIQRAHVALIQANRDFVMFIADECYPLGGDRQGLPLESKGTKPWVAKFKALDGHAERMLTAFDDFARVAKQRLRM